MTKVRLQKVIQQAGMASRRGAEEMIQEGSVRVNGAIVTQMGLMVDPEKDAIKVAGKIIHKSLFKKNVYLALYKPRGVICTADDPQHRKTCFDLIPQRFKHLGLSYAGRLDLQSEGLLILSNDGKFILHCTHPRYHLTKTYLVKSRGHLNNALLNKLRRGIVIDGKRTLPARVKHIPKKDTKHAWYEVTLSEGRQQQIRKMFYTLGHGVTKLKRIKIGSIKLGRMIIGQVRPLTEREIKTVVAPERQQEYKSKRR